MTTRDQDGTPRRFRSIEDVQRAFLPKRYERTNAIERPGADDLEARAEVAKRLAQQLQERESA